jgi:hypothetical protein
MFLPDKYETETWPQYLKSVLWGLGLRRLTFWWQRRTRGFDDSDTWSLDFTICKFAMPRIRHLAATTHGYPSELLYGESMTEESVAAHEKLPEEYQKCLSDAAFVKWQTILEKMARSMEIWVEGDCWYEQGTPEEVEFKEGMDLFHKYFFALWD